jgi:hypothetical protein
VSETFSKKRRGNQEASGGLTPMQSAFLAGLLDWAQRETGDELIAIPTGVVDPAELRQVIVALKCARDERRQAA